MTTRDLTIIAIRLIALWYACVAVGNVVWWGWVLAEVFTGGAQPYGPFSTTYQMVLPILPGVVAVVIAVLLFRYAAPIADTVCRDVDHERAKESALSLSAADVFGIAVFILGVVVMLQAVTPAVSAVVDLMGHGAAAATTVINLTRAIIYLVFGAGLALGRRGIAEFISSLGHSADNTPLQRFSVRTVLVVVTTCAVVLGLIRVVLP